MKKIPHAEIILVVLGTLLYFFANVHRIAVPGAIFDVLQKDLLASAKAITALGTIFMYVYAISQLLIGLLIARIGGFMVITMGAIIFFIGCLLFPMASTLPLLYISRILIGIGSASFYLGLIDETRKIVDSKNFGMIISIILLIGYFGGIVANAPLVICIHKLGWRQTFMYTGMIIMVISSLFAYINSTRPLPKENKSVKFNLDLFKEVFKEKKNIFLYLSTGINYGIFFVLLTVIGKKFIEDFCYIPVVKAAAFLSIASALYAISGLILAYISKLWYYRKAIFLRIATFNTLLSMLVILFCIVFNIRTSLICYLLCTVAVLSNLSALSVPLLHDYNTERTASTSVSILTCTYYLAVGLFGSIIGFLLDLYTPILNTLSQNKHVIYTNKSYTAIFITLAILALIAFISSFGVKETKTTRKLINWYHHD